MRHGGFRLDLGGTADGKHSPDSDIPRLLSFYSNVRARIARFAAAAAGDAVSPLIGFRQHHRFVVPPTSAQ